MGYNSTKKGTEYKWRVNREEKLDLGMLFVSCLHWLSALHLGQVLELGYASMSHLENKNITPTYVEIK